VRSAEELRQRWLDSIPLIMKRAGMYARDGREMEAVAGQLLRDLCFLDERDGDYEQAQDRLRGYGQLGVHGPRHVDVRLRAVLPGRGRLASTASISLDAVCTMYICRPSADANTESPWARYPSLPVAMS
jgi:hypothetical protein